MTRPGGEAAVGMQLGIKIPLRDGVRLDGTLYRPKDPLPVPSIVTLTPYIGQTYHEQGLFFAAHGYVFIAVDVRGRGNSEGEFQPLIQEARDGYDVVEWLARQPYCNGQVAMWGGSYGGYTQWATARERPPHLATIVPVAAACPGVDFPIRNNISSPYVMQWLTLVFGRTLQDRIFWNNERFWRSRYRQWLESGTSFEELDRFLGHPSPIFQQWTSHPHQDAYWDRYNPSEEDYASISQPVLTITGIYDADQPGALQHYRAHTTWSALEARARHFLIIGPWDHAGTRAPQLQFAAIRVGPASLIDLGKLHLEWYAWTLQRGAKPRFLQRNVAYYVLGADEWRYADTLDAVTAWYETAYLDSQGPASGVFAAGVLTETPGSGEPNEYAYDPHDLGNADREALTTEPLALRPTFPTDNLHDQTPVMAGDGRLLVYHSAPFEREREIAGFFKLSLWLSIDQPDTDFRACVYEISPSGESLLLSSDCLRARYRESLREPKLITTPAPLLYEFVNFTFVARQVSAGSRLRLVIGPINSIYFEKNYNSGGTVSKETISDARVVTVRLYHDPTHPSALHIPWGQAASGEQRE